MVEVDLDQASLVLYLEEGHGDDLVDLEDLADLVNQAGLEDLVHFLENDFAAMPCCQYYLDNILVLIKFKIFICFIFINVVFACSI